MNGWRVEDASERGAEDEEGDDDEEEAVDEAGQDLHAVEPGTILENTRKTL